MKGEWGEMVGVGRGYGGERSWGGEGGEGGGKERKKKRKNYPAPAPPFGQQARKTRAATLAVLPAE